MYGTKTTLKNSFHGHESTFNTLETETPIGQNFNLPNHTTSDMIIECIEFVGNYPIYIASSVCTVNERQSLISIN